MGKGKKWRAMCCGAVLQSMHRHDFVTCKCGAVRIDGGDDYLKVSVDPEKICLAHALGKVEGEVYEEEKREIPR